MSTDDLTCRELIELVTDYLEGAFTLSERRRFEEHLGGCSVCPHYVDQLRLTVHMLGRLTEDDLPEPARGELLETFRTWKAT
jgi:predicted anti-sigma-YlaC factor YlaD